LLFKKLFLHPEKEKDMFPRGAAETQFESHKLLHGEMAPSEFTGS
jgi:hypothetical protein